MNKPHSLLAAGLCAAGAIALVNYKTNVLAQDQSTNKQDQSTKQQDQTKTTGAGGAFGQTAQTANLPSGVTRSDRADEAGIRSTLGQAAEAATKENGLSNLSMYLSSADRARLTGLRENAQYTRSVQKLRQAYKEKYNQELAFKDDAASTQFKDIVIVQGEVTNPALLSNWPVDNSRSGASGTYDRNTTPADRTTKSDRDRATPGAPGNASTIEGSKTVEGGTSTVVAGRSVDRGMNIAVATFPAKQGHQEVTVSLIREGTNAGAGVSGRVDAGGADVNARAGLGAAGSDWKIDLPDSITADKLQTNLARHIDMITSMKDQWPSDANEANAKITKHVMMALYDVAGTGTNGGANQSGRIGGER